jgi:hypothetical protein
LLSLKPEETQGEYSNDTTEATSIYNYDPETYHNYILIAKSESVNLNALKVRLSDFNRKYFKNKRFAISSFKLNEGYQLVTISRFDNGSLALSYLKAVENDSYVLSIFNNEEDYKHFVISNENYLLFYKDKNIDNYHKFFKRFY